MRIPSGVVDQWIYIVAVDSTDLKTRETGISSWTVYRSRNGGTATAYTTPTITEVSSSNMPGVYKLLLDEDMTIDSGDQSQEVCLHITATGVAPITRVFELYRPSVTDGQTLTVTSGRGNADVTHIATAAVATGTAQLGVNVVNWKGSAAPNMTGDAYARLGAPAGASVSADVAAVKSQTAAIETDTQDLQTQIGTAGAGLTAVAPAVMASNVEGTVTLTESMRLQNAVLLGKASGLATTTAVYRDLADTKARVTATVDADGNRSAVTLDDT